VGIYGKMILRKERQVLVHALKKLFNFWAEAFLWLAFKKQVKRKCAIVLFGSKDSFVTVLQLLSVRLMLGFAGIWLAFLPQYFTRAILLGALH
jgi:hypothetical protein